MTKLTSPPMLHGDNPNFRSDVEKNPKTGKITSTHVNMTMCARISAHSMRWTWIYDGATKRRPDSIRRMRGWNGYVYHWEGCAVILNVRTLELYLHSRPYKSTEKMMSATWSKADRIAREFSRWAEVAITPIESGHPLGVQAAHLVINQKRINRPLLPGRADSPERRMFIGKNRPYADARRTGAIEDGSHPGKVEMVGQESVEGGIGLDWLLLDYPGVVRQSLEMNTRFSRNLELHLKVLQEIRDAVRRMRK